MLNKSIYRPFDFEGYHFFQMNSKCEKYEESVNNRTFINADH
jgi:hypothetical protein